MHDMNDYDPNEYRAVEAELRDRYRGAPRKIPAGIYQPPLRANGKRSSWWESAKRRGINFQNKAYGDFDRRFAEAATRRVENEFLADELYGGEDEMIEALDEAYAEDNDGGFVSDNSPYADYPMDEDLHRKLRTVVRFKKRIRFASKEEVLQKARQLARQGRCADSDDILDLARDILQRPTWVKIVAVIEDHDPLPPLDAEEQAEARKHSSEFIRESDRARRRRFQQHVADKANRRLRPDRIRGGRNGGSKPRHKPSLAYYHAAA